MAEECSRGSIASVATVHGRARALGQHASPGPPQGDRHSYLEEDCERLSGNLLKIPKADVHVSCVNLVESARRVGLLCRGACDGDNLLRRAAAFDDCISSYALEDFFDAEIEGHDGTLLDHSWTAEPPPEPRAPGLCPEQPLKVVLVGDTRCGKTALANRFVSDAFTTKRAGDEKSQRTRLTRFAKCAQDYTPTGFDRYTTHHEVAGQKFYFSVWDTSGSTAYDTVRPLSYQDASVVLLCFNVGVPESLHNVIHKWQPEVRQHCPGAALLLIGCQSDARMAQRGRIGGVGCVSADEALTWASRLGAVAYVETSARAAPRSVQDAWKAAAQAALGPDPEAKNRDASPSRHKACILM
ncbi:hypothetical protein HPB48_019672 [Haemaphysalis longicornis]|uniref:Uncharacterized protein n=1 Tax=Haemaphysalis longicornis TaxID=44386 RepID=A0A9J6G496_HAELO|nr:hypothetical protein HPB48_019672 [Haemaphysalis longicornis]